MIHEAATGADLIGGFVDMIEPSQAEGFKRPSQKPMRSLQRLEKPQNAALADWLALHRTDASGSRTVAFWCARMAASRRLMTRSICSMEVGDGQTYRESNAYQPGAEAVLADTPFARIGMTICYDVRFAHLYRALAKAGAQVLTVPAAFTQVTGEAHWHVRLRARAIETGCWVIAPAQTGEHAEGRRTFGHSLVVAPWGEIVADAGTAVGVTFAEIDLAAVTAARRRVPALINDRDFKFA